jgi:hypothetical protein
MHLISKSLVDFIRECIDHPEKKLQICVDDGTPNGWRPNPELTHPIGINYEVNTCTILFAQDVASPHMQPRILAVRADRIVWASVLDETPGIVSTPIVDKRVVWAPDAPSAAEERYIHSLMNAEGAE